MITNDKKFNELKRNIDKMTDQIQEIEKEIKTSTNTINK